jgi:hypothetical protein
MKFFNQVFKFKNVKLQNALKYSYKFFGVCVCVGGGGVIFLTHNY